MASDTLLDFATSQILALCAIPSPSGFTRAAEEYLVAELKALGFEPQLTRKRVIQVCLGGQGHPLVLAAHLDTLGAMVRAIKPDGRLRLSKIGGFPENTIEGESVLVHTRDGKQFPGTVQLLNPSVHANRHQGEVKRDDTTMELVLDLLVATDDEVRARGIGPGDFVSFDTRTALSGEGFLKSRHLDDKASSGLLLALAQAVSQGTLRPQRQVWLVFTNYEEVGHGASAALPPGVVDFVSVDMGVVGDDVGATERHVSICAKDSQGPYDWDLTNRLIALARRQGLNFAVDVYPFYGSDADAALVAGHDVRHGLVGPGVYASHGYERTHREGLSHTLALLQALVEEPFSG